MQKSIIKPRKSPCKDGQSESFRTELEKIIDLGHSLVKLSKTMDWKALEKHFGAIRATKSGVKVGRKSVLAILQSHEMV